MAGTGTKPSFENRAASIKPVAFDAFGKQEGAEGEEGHGLNPQVPKTKIQTWGRNTGALSGRPTSRQSRRGRSG
jgi:hypothetical protein